MNQLFTKRKSCFTFYCNGIPLLKDLDRGIWLPQGGTGYSVLLSVIFLFSKKDFYKVPEEGREGEPGTVRVSPANK